jgi:transcriptional regulator NrdR family protein
LVHAKERSNSNAFVSKDVNKEGIQMRLRVIKADGSVEEYLHTKVIGAISNALTRGDHADIHTAEQLAEVVTYYLYHRENSRIVTSGEIFSIVQAVLTTTGYEEAAIVLSDHHFERKLKRSRTEVISVDIQQLSDAEALDEFDLSANRSRWDKSRVVQYLTTKHNVSQQTARMIASMVEEKIFKMGITLVPAGLVKQLVLGDAAAVLRAERLLQTV